MVTVSWFMMPGTEIFIRVFGITAVGWMFSVFFDDMRKLRGMILFFIHTCLCHSAENYIHDKTSSKNI